MPPMGKGPGGKKMPSGGPKPKNMKKTLGTLLRYLSLIHISEPTRRS